MRYLNVPIIPAQVAATVTSDNVPSEYLFYVSAQITATDSAAGTLVIQCSNDSGQDTLPVNWNNIPSATVSVTGAGSYLIPKIDVCYQWLRVVYTNTGSGTFGVSLQALGN